jgi:hypothetical protein
VIDIICLIIYYAYIKIISSTTYRRTRISYTYYYYCYYNNILVKNMCSLCKKLYKILKIPSFYQNEIPRTKRITPGTVSRNFILIDMDESWKFFICFLFFLVGFDRIYISSALLLFIFSYFYFYFDYIWFYQ